MKKVFVLVGGAMAQQGEKECKKGDKCCKKECKKGSKKDKEKTAIAAPAAPAKPAPTADDKR